MRIGAITAGMAACLALSGARAQPGCANWNGADFFGTASAGDVRACLLAGADPDARNESGATPLHFAAREGDAAAIATLLEAGVDPGARYRRGHTPLHDAAHEGDAGAIAALLEGGADPNARNWYGRTPLHDAAVLGHAAAIVALLDGGADPGARSRSGRTPFDLIGKDSPLTGTPAWTRLRDATRAVDEAGGEHG